MEEFKRLEQQRTLEFQQKLNSIQSVQLHISIQASKQIKNKNIQSLQKQEWHKEMLSLQKHERYLAQDQEQRLLCLEIQQDIPKFYLTSTLESNKQEYQQFQEEITQNISNLKRIKSQLTDQGRQAKPQGCQTLKDLLKSFQQYMESIDQKLKENTFLQMELMDEDCEDNLDCHMQNQRQLISYKSQIQSDYENDKLLAYGVSAKDEEFELLQNYTKALNFLYERYQLELLQLDPGKKMDINQQLLYLASSNSLHSIQRLMMHFPKLSRTQLQNVVDYIRKQKDLNKRLGIVIRQWRQLQHRSEQLLNELYEDKVLKNEKWLNYLMLKQYRIQLAEELEEKRVVYDEQKREEALCEQAKQAELEQLDQQKYQMWLQHKAAIFEEALAYKQAKEERSVQLRLEYQLEQETIRREQQQQVEKAKPAIRQRQERESEKINEKLYNIERTKLLKSENNQRIENAINKYSIRPNVERDFDRVTKETEARVIRKQTKMDMADKVQLSNVTGFNVDQLMSDMRFRLQVALNEAGLSQTKYAHEIINQMSRPK